MIALKEEGQTADGPPPCVYEADILFLSQDVNLKESIANITLSVDTLKSETAIVDYGVSKLTLKFENETWKISKIH